MLLLRAEEAEGNVVDAEAGSSGRGAVQGVRRGLQRITTQSYAHLNNFQERSAMIPSAQQRQ